MRLTRLIYASTIKKDTDPSELKKIHEKALHENPKNSITGILVFGEDFFLQCIEGGRDSVNRLYAKIANDPRHDHSVLIDYSEIDERKFVKWSMKLFLLTKEHKLMIQRFSLGDRFNPYEMSGPSALRFLHELTD